MRRSSLLALIIVESLTMFCLSVLGDRVAALVSLPTPVLLACATLGIIVTTVIAYWKQTPASEKTDTLTFREIWQRLKPRKRHRLLFGPRLSNEQENRLMSWSLGLAFWLGVVGGIVRPFFTQRGLFSSWYIMLGIFLCISLTPLFLFNKRYSSGNSSYGIGEMLLGILIGGGIFLFIYGLLMLGGLAVGSLVLYLVLWIVSLFTH